eukprot:Nk52_evm33s288 gene=Nk52_evmTU33s288
MLVPGAVGCVFSTLIVNGIAVLNFKFDKKGPGFDFTSENEEPSVGDKVKTLIENIRYFRIVIVFWNIIVLFLMMIDWTSEEDLSTQLKITKTYKSRKARTNLNASKKGAKKDAQKKAVTFRKNSKVEITPEAENQAKKFSQKETHPLKGVGSKTKSALNRSKEILNNQKAIVGGKSRSAKVLKKSKREEVNSLITEYVKLSENDIVKRECTPEVTRTLKSSEDCDNFHVMFEG